jgi:3-deoxy-manno-octulosonate cytidylyltransferase (CMP-KDO synthetase)
VTDNHPTAGAHEPAAVVIPARYAATRLPGKPLLELLGKPMVQYVYDAARQAALVGPVIVATDDARILEAVKGFGGQAVLTSPAHPTGTDRVAEVAGSLAQDIIINIQADEPEIKPAQIDQLARLLLEDRQAVMATLASEISDEKQASNPNVVKVVCDRRGKALYFSRAPIPYAREKGAGQSWLQHLGIYGYRRQFLLKLCRLERTSLEELEKLEQLRVLEHGFTIRVGLTEHVPASVDTVEDYHQLLERYQSSRGAK